LNINACLEDNRENNDVIGSASPVTIAFDQAGLQSCPDDEDWYSFNVQQGKTIDVDAIFTHADGDIDIYLHNPAGSQIAFSNGTANNESITAVAATTGSYRLRVRLFAGTPPEGNDYRLLISTTQPDATNTPAPSSTPSPTGTSAPTSTPSPPAATSTPSPTMTLAKALGDVNDDGQVTAVDAALILQLSAGIIPSLVNPGSADVNEDGSINAIDATLILQFVAGIISTLPP
jgi:hypothetical protein